MTMTINGSGTITGLTAGGLPSATINQTNLNTNVAGNGPAFRAYLSSNQNVTSNTWTKVALNAETFDTANAFDSSTNYRFTPQIAGYYQMSALMGGNSPTTQTSGQAAFYKNGSKYGAQIGSSLVSGTFGNIYVSCSDLIYLNGSTDYVELYGTVTGTSPFFGGPDTFMCGFLARAA